MSHVTSLVILGTLLTGAAQTAFGAEPDPPAAPAVFPAVTNGTAAQPQLSDTNTVEVTEPRPEIPAPQPPLPPMGLQGIVWAFAHPQDAWRLVAPIPSDQVPAHLLAANEP